MSQVVPGGLPRNVEAAVQRYGSATYSKAPAATVLDPNGKLSLSLTYGKLLSRSMKIAHALLSSQVRGGEINWVFFVMHSAATPILRISDPPLCEYYF